MTAAAIERIHRHREHRDRLRVSAAAGRISRINGRLAVLVRAVRRIGPACPECDTTMGEHGRCMAQCHERHLA